MVELIRTTGKTVGHLARELDLTETAVRQGFGAGLGAADYQHRPVGELVGTAVVGGLILGNPVGERAGKRRDLRQVLVAGGDQDGAG